MRKFTEVLEEYLVERDRQNSDYYDDKYLGSAVQGREYMSELAQEMDRMIHGVYK